MTANVGLPMPDTRTDTSPGYGPLLKAENNWWGVRNFGIGTPTPAPEISPTTNPPVPENPVNGVSAPDEIAGQTTSNAVDFYPYRNGPQSDPTAGAWPGPDRPAAGRRRRADGEPRPLPRPPIAAPRSR